MAEVVTDQHLADRVLKGIPDVRVRAQLQLQLARLRTGRRQTDTAKHLRGPLGSRLVARKFSSGPWGCHARIR